VYQKRIKSLTDGSARFTVPSWTRFDGRESAAFENGAEADRGPAGPRTADHRCAWVPGVKRQLDVAGRAVRRPGICLLTVLRPGGPSGTGG